MLGLYHTPCPVLAVHMVIFDISLFCTKCPCRNCAFCTENYNSKFFCRAAQHFVNVFAAYPELARLFVLYVQMFGLSRANCNHPAARLVEINRKGETTMNLEQNFSLEEEGASMPAQQADNLGAEPAKPKKSNKPIIFALAGVVVVLVAVIALVLAKNAQKKAAIAAERAEYLDNLNEFVDKTIIGGAAAEKACNLTKSVWYDTIYEEYRAETAEYTRTDGSFNEDFNTSLAALYASDEMQTWIDVIEENQTEVEALYKELLNPTDEFTKCFDEVESLYSLYYKFTNLALSPSGSLTTYASDFSEYDDEFMEHYDKLKLIIPAE